ncbi:MAG: spermidine synthase [Verrucomicrobiota bacterium]|nr:spermidine synthase [Verrucomicrobiota bacterium]
MSRDFEELAYHRTPLGELSLRRRRIRSLDHVEVYEVKLADAFLMSSLFTTVEVELAHLGLAQLRGSGWDVVVGGLGLGYTARAALEHTEVASMLVIDALAPVIEWHERGLVPLGSELTSDPRTRLLEADFFARALSEEGFDTDQPGRRFDAVLLDIDHSPRNLLHSSNAVFYGEQGLRALASKLRTGGVFAMWSDDPPDDEFMTMLEGVFERVDAHVVPFYNPILETDAASTVYVACSSLRTPDAP